jgi:hypothetical protein
MSLQEEVKRIAFELYEKNGRREGRDLLDWLAAEQIVRFQQMIFSGMDGKGIGLLEYKPLSEEDAEPAPTSKAQSRSRKPSRGRRPEAGKRTL